MKLPGFGFKTSEQCFKKLRFEKEVNMTRHSLLLQVMFALEDENLNGLN